MTSVALGTCAGVAVCLALLEIGLRVAYGHPPAFLDPQVRHQSEPYGYKPVPNQRGVFTLDKPVTTNSFGFRDTEWAVPKPAGTVRIMVVGDSFTFGNNNRVEDLYVTRVERRLQRELGAHVEVINTSAGGWDLDNEVAFWRLEGIRYDPDIVVVGLFLNDLLLPRDLATVFDETGRLDARPGWLRWIPYSAVFAAKRSAAVFYVREMVRALGAGDGFVSQAVANRIDAATDPRLAHARDLLRQLAASCRERDVSLVVAAIPPLNLFRRGPGPVGVLDEIKALAGREGITYVDLAEPFWDVPDPEAHYGYPWDNHFIASGHALAADALYPVLAPLVRDRLERNTATTRTFADAMAVVSGELLRCPSGS